jgi:hypothetical protein
LSEHPLRCGGIEWKASPLSDAVNVFPGHFQPIQRRFVMSGCPQKAEIETAGILQLMPAVRITIPNRTSCIPIGTKLK